MAAPTIAEPRFTNRGDDTTERSVAPADTGRQVMYWLSMAAVYVLQGGLWYYAAEEKIIGGNLKAPPGIEKAFGDSFIATFPGTGFAWAVVSIAEAAIVVALAVSLIRGEFCRRGASRSCSGRWPAACSSSARCCSGSP